MRSDRWKVLLLGLLAALSLATACDDDDDKKCNQEACVDCLDNLPSGDSAPGTSSPSDDPLKACDNVCDACGL